MSKEKDSDSVKKKLVKSGLMNENGDFTEKSTKYVPTDLLDFEELEKAGIINNVKKI